MRATHLILAALVLLGLSLGSASSLAQSDPQGQYVTLPGVPGATKAVLWTPTSGNYHPAAILAIHRTSNFLTCGDEWSKRGFLALCMNPRFDNNEASVRWEDIALDISAGMNFLRRQPGISYVILEGFSGGGPSTSFYQAVAQNGPAYCQGSNKLVQCPDRLAGLVPADGMMLRDAHPGNPVNGIRSINPAVLDDTRPDLIDPTLDPFNPANGYNPNGASSYSDEFKARYFHAQADRMNRLIDDALDRVRQMEEGTYQYPDDDVFLVVRGEGGRLMQLDPSIHHSTMQPRKVVLNDGSIVTRMAESVRLGDPSLARNNPQFEGGTRLLTIRSFLSANATRATDSMEGIDWCSTNNSTVCAVRQITVPLLVVTMGAHYFIRDGEVIYENAASADKDYAMIEGAVHGGQPCVPCESFPGQFSNSVKNRYDYMEAWLRAHF
jgi:hypothetical protein